MGTVIRQTMATFGFILGAVSAHPAAALVINPIYDSSVTTLSNAGTVEAAFNAVAQDYATSFDNGATVNVAVSWGAVAGTALPSNAVGASVSSLYGYFSYAQVGSYLANAASSNPSDTALATAVANLPVTAPAGQAQYVIPSAQAKALGLVSNPTSVDGSIGFAGSSAGYDFNPSDGVDAGKYDFQAVAAHELDEVLGRISGLAASSPSYATPYDLFRYSAPGTTSFSYTSPAYFSIDGGQTDLNDYNVSSGGGDRADWAGNTNDIQNAFVGTGQSLNLSAADLSGLDILGYGGSNIGDTAAGSPATIAFALVGTTPTDVPEPGSLALTLTGLAALAAVGRLLNRNNPGLAFTRAFRATARTRQPG